MSVLLQCNCILSFLLFQVYPNLQGTKSHVQDTEADGIHLLLVQNTGGQ